MSTDLGFQFDNSYLNLPEVFYSRLAPTPVASPHMLLLNEPLVEAMGLKLSDLTPADQAELFAGNRLPEGATPFAQAYAGHQFGHLTMLGDGRAHVIGEQITPSGERLDIQLKGSGPTPYSRSGDGRAVLGPMLREYVISEAMHALGIPTTRALAVVSTGEQVRRETMLPGAILTRVASSHLRVGTFEFASGQQDLPTLEALLDYTIQRHAPELADADNRAIALLEHVMQRQADLIVHWMRVGFIHGVMNTDNMALSGETIDYGPCAFMDTYDPQTVFSSIDHQGRYAYANQPAIAMWNLVRLAEAMLPLIGSDVDEAVEQAEESVNGFAPLYQGKWLAMMRDKLGLFGEEEADAQLIADLLKWMKLHRADFTNTFLGLTRSDQPQGEVYEKPDVADWLDRWRARRTRNDQPLDASVALMQRTNPAVIPRNLKVEEALKAAEADDLQPVHDLLAALRDPYNDRATLEPYQAPPGPESCAYQTFCGT